MRDKVTARATGRAAASSAAAQAQIIAVNLLALDQRLIRENANDHKIGSLTHMEPALTRELLPPAIPLHDGAALLVGGQAVDPARSAAGLLHLEGIACRPFDSFRTDVTAWVIEDFSPIVPEPADVDRIHSVIERLRAAGEVTCAPGWDANELCRTAVGGRGAVYCGLDRVMVADRFATVRRIVDERTRTDLHYGSEVAVRGRRYLYQTIPGVGTHGRRETSRRWELITSMLTDADESLRQKVVLDIGCNAGMMLAAALTDGALWGLGWDLPKVVRHARQLLYALGYTRFDLVGEDLQHDSSLMSSISDPLRPALDDCVVLFLAIRHHLGFLPDLVRVPWRLMVYEGGASERTATLNRSLEDLHRICAFDVVAATDFRDGETGKRPVALLIRRDTDGSAARQLEADGRRTPKPAGRDASIRPADN